MRIHLKKRFTALMLAGMMVTSNVLPAYSATDGIAVEQADASYEAEATAADASAAAENSEVGGVSSEQGDAEKPVTDGTDSTTDASGNATSDSASSTAASGMENTGVVSGAENVSDASNTSASGTVGSDTSENTGAPSAAEKSDMIVLETSAASTEIETTGAATDITGGTAAGSDANVSGGTSTSASGVDITAGGAGAGSTALGESAVETGAVETTPAETLESVPETTVEETTVPESTEAAKKVKLTFHIVDEDGEDIDEKYVDVKVSFDQDGMLALDDSEKAPVRNIRKLTGTRLFGLLRTYSKNYTYKEATLDGDIIRAIRKTTDEDEHTVYEYTMDGENWTTFEEDSEILLVYSAPETKGSGHAEYIEEGKIKVVVDLKKDLPEGVELRVQEVTDEDQNYDAYMTALDDAAKASASEIEKHSNENTLLYDIAFIGHDEDGQEYEYQPGEDVSVKVSFLGGQLAGELGASDADNVVIKHLPVKDEVKENAAKDGQRTTADMTDLSADDIQVEDVKKAKVTLDTEAKIATVDEEEDEDEEKEVAESKDEVTFKTDSFSLWSFSAVASVAAGNSYSEKEIKDILGITTKYGVFARELSHETDMEATIAAKHVSKIGSDFGFSNNNYGLVNNKITVKKKFKDKYGKPLANKAVTIQLYLNGTLYRSQDVTTGTDGSASTTFEKVSDGDYSLGEVYNGQTFTPAKKDHTFPDDTTVKASFSDPVSIATNYSNVNYIGDVPNDLWAVVVSKSRGGVVIVDNEEDYNGMKQYASKDGVTVLLADAKTRIDFDEILEQLEELSRNLVNAVDSDTVKVFNIFPQENNWFDTNFVTIDEKHPESRYVVLNIDCSGKTSVALGARFKIDGTQLRDSFTDDGKKILYNFYTRDGENIKPYTGEITLAAGNAGVMLAPRATVGHLGGNFAGTIVADTCNHTGSEVHGSNFNSAESVHLKMDIVNEYTETTSATIHKVWDDADNKEKQRPDELTVTLMKRLKDETNQTEVKSVKLNSKNGWTATIDNLPKKEDGKEIIYSWAEGCMPTGYSLTNTSTDGTVTTLTNSYTTETTSATVRKVWNDSNNQDGKRPDALTVDLMNGETVVDTVTLNAANSWTATVGNLPKYADGTEITYSWAEGTMPEGYSLTDTSKDGTVTTLTNSYTTKTTSATVKKIWNDAENQDGKRPADLTVKLMNGEMVVDTVTLNAANSWTATVGNLPKYADGTEITYSWAEGTMPEGYSLTDTSKAGTVTTLTNSYTTKTTSATVKKIWNDAENQDGKRPADLTVKLMNGETVVDTVTLNAANSWTATVGNLPKYADGKEITYSWAEGTMPAGYSLTDTSKAGTVTTLTNSYTTKTTSATVKKIWNDAENQDGKRPADLTVKLMNGETVVDTVTLNAANSWTATVGNLPKYADGTEITYSWAEGTMPAGYSLTDTSKAGTVTTLTNSYTTKTTSVTVKKIWNDAENQDGKRPADLTVKLMNGETVVDTVTLNAANSWTATVADLPKYANGTEITYSWVEGAMPAGYSLTDRSKTGTVTALTNTHEIATTSVLVRKTWDDSNDASGKRPSEIKVKLYADHVLKAEHTLTADASGDWSYEFTDLPVYKEGYVGQKINYTVTEEEIPGYVLTGSESSVKDGKTVVQLTNKSIDFKVNKFERTGTRELDGAKIQIKDSTGAVVAEWISKSGETYDFGSKLKAGATYTIHEETAPSGYYTISDMNFTVGEKGEITLAGSSDDVKLEDGVIKICDERIKSSGGGGGGDHPHPTPETTPAETTPAETTVPETTPVETTTPDGGNGGNHGPSEEVETDEYGRVRGANRGKNKKDQDGGNVKGANRGKTRTGDESMMSIFGFGFLAAVLVLLGWFGIRFTKRNRR